MTPRVVLALAIAAAAVAAARHEPSRPAPPVPAGRPVQISRIHDGDTVTLATGETIRLVGVDAPELGQAPWGERSRAALADLLGRGPLRLEVEPKARDPYGRTLGTLTVGGRSAGADLVRLGLAFAWTPAGRRHPARWAELTAAEAEARSAGRGAWSADPPIERPDAWRRDRRNGAGKGPGMP